MPHAPYTLWAPFYDAFVEPVLRRLRAKAVRELDLSSGQSLLIVGVGTGLDLPLLPKGVEVAGLDLNSAMLERARRRAGRLGISARLEIGNAERLPYPDESFDRVYLPLIVAVAEDGAGVLSEALRVLKRGGRAVVMDKFMPGGTKPLFLWRLAEAVAGRLATHVDRRWDDLAAQARQKSDFRVVSNFAGPLGGFFRVIALEKN